MSSIFEIGTRSLSASQYALSVTSQNISNANDPFYSRREVDFSEAFDKLFGNGVNVSDVRRIFDNAINKSALKITGNYGRASVLNQNMQNLESMFDNGKFGIAGAINESINVLNVLNASPSSMQSRNLYLYQLNNMVRGFHDLENRVSAEQKNINNALNTDVDTVNDTLQKLAQLNTRIVTASADEALDILDARDSLQNKLASLVGFESTTDSRNVLNITLANGTPLLLGNSAYTMSTAQSATEYGKLDILTGNHQSHTIVTDMIGSGEIAGQLAYQNYGLDISKQSLGRLALVISQTMNDLNRQGIDLQGEPGGNIFNDLNESSAAQNRVFKNTHNQGDARLEVVINDAKKLVNSDYQLQFDTPSHFVLTRKSDHQLVSSGNVDSLPFAISADGFSINLDSGHFAAGDSFTLSPTRNAASDLNMVISDAGKLAFGLPGGSIGDNRNGLAFADLYQESVLDNNTLNFSQACQSINNTLAVNTSSAKIAFESNSIIKQQAEARRDQVSGVSLQEEAVNLARYQQAYQASAQIIDVGQKIFETLISLGRR